MPNIRFIQDIIDCAISSERKFKSFNEILEHLSFEKIEMMDRDQGVQDRMNINFYPSDIKGRCHEVAYFMSLQGKGVTLKKGKIPFDKMMKLFIKHCQGSCIDKVKHAIIITDKHDNDEIEFWQSNINNIKKNGVRIELLIIVQGKVQQTILL